MSPHKSLLTWPRAGGTCGRRCGDDDEFFTPVLTELLAFWCGCARPHMSRWASPNHLRTVPHASWLGSPSRYCICSNPCVLLKKAMRICLMPTSRQHHGSYETRTEMHQVFPYQGLAKRSQRCVSSTGTQLYSCGHYRYATFYQDIKARELTWLWDYGDNESSQDNLGSIKNFAHFKHHDWPISIECTGEREQEDTWNSNLMSVIASSITKHLEDTKQM